MRKLVVTLTLAAVPGLIFSACNGGAGSSGSATLPNVPAAAHHVHPADNGPQDLHAGGATFPAYAYNLANQPVGNYNNPQEPPGEGSLFYAAPTQGTAYYCLTGSGAGRKAFEGGPGDAGAPPTGPCAPLGATPTGFGGRVDPLDFVGTDAAMPSTEYPTYVQYREPASGEQWGEPFEFPTLGGPVVYGFRPKDFQAQVSQIKLSRWTFCAIANGTISNWNDPAITADNGKSITGGVAQTITYFFRSDSSGTTFVYTTDLNAACNLSWKAPYNAPPYESSGHSAAWTFGISTTWPGPGSVSDPNPNFIGESGNPGVLAAVQSTPFATGYLEGAYAKSANPHVGQALLQNGYRHGKALFVDPTNAAAVAGALAKVTSAAIDYGGGSDGMPLGTSKPWCILFIPPSNFDLPPAKTYPIVGVSYMLFYGHNNGVHLQDKKTLIKYMTSTAADNVLSPLEYTALPASIHTAVRNALKGVGHPACLR